MSLIELREGAYYRARNGTVFGPLKYDRETDTAYVFEPPEADDTCISWTAQGREHRYAESENDLIAEVHQDGSYLIDEAPAAACDPVSHPAHYTAGGIECIDAIQAAVGPEQFKGYLRGNVLKYLWRYEHKGGVESLRKAQWYLDRLIQANA